MRYEAFILIHLIGVVLFFSGFSGSLFMKMRAERTGDPRILAHTFAAMNVQDKWFTPLSILLIMVGGFGSASLAGLSVTGTGWIFWSLVLYGFSGLIFVLRALPLQHRIETLLSDGIASGELDWGGYQTLAKSWNFWAILAFTMVTITFVLMVLKPTLPTL